MQACRHADLLQQASVKGLRGGIPIDAEAFGQARRDQRAAELEAAPPSTAAAKAAATLLRALKGN